MLYTSSMSIFFLIAATASAYAAGRITPQSKKTAAFARYGEARLIRPALWIAAVLFIAGNIVGIGTLPTL
ncbi:MAG: hypothetical protein J6S14_15760 [Clostridia bacterium]|nr:hypothetical protein [Clostridia bacterium]